MLLAGEQRVLGTFPLTDPSALSLAETAVALQDITGRGYSYEQETVDDAFAERSGLGAPQWVVETWVRNARVYSSKGSAPEPLHRTLTASDQ